MITTPIGTILLLIDGKAVEYSEQKIEPDNLCPDIDGRYKISFSYRDDSNIKNSVYCQRLHGKRRLYREASYQLECSGQIPKTV